MEISTDCDKSLFSDHTNTAGNTARTRDPRTYLAIHRAREERTRLALGLFRTTANIRITGQELPGSITPDIGISDTT
jgi:hypothetical protein